MPADAWERTVFTTFHDAIPGSSIAEVYAELNPQLAAVSAQAESATAALLAAGDESVTRFNPLPVPWNGIVEANGEWVPVCLPALATAEVAACRVPAATPTWDGSVLANEHVRIRFDEEGTIKEMILDGASIPLKGSPGLWMAEDHPPRHDAWETDIDDVRAARPLPLGKPERVADDGGYLAVAQAVVVDGAHIGHLLWRLAPGSRSLDLRLEVDWQLDHRLLRFCVPTAFEGRMARFGAPFGMALRNQLPGYEQDEARWDGAGSRWAAVTNDIADDGLAIISQASYGFAARSGVLTMSLLRAPRSPDPTNDRGQQSLNFQLRRFHATSSAESESTALSAETAYASPALAGQPSASLASWSQLGGLVPSWTEPQNDAVVFRAHETAGAAGKAILTLSSSLGHRRPWIF